jgi:hypothetical protein
LRKNFWRAQRVISVSSEIISGTSLNAAVSRRSQADTETFAHALGRLAIAANMLPTFCAFVVPLGAVRSAALAKAAHPAGDIAPAAASTLPIQLKHFPQF